MALAQNKTMQTNESVLSFIETIENEQKKQDSIVIMELMKKATGEEPKMWGASMIGFGYEIIKSPSGREVEWFKLGFAPRKSNLTLYLMSPLMKDPKRMSEFGKHKTGGGCLYINKLSDVNMDVLEQLINDCVKIKNAK